MAVHGMAADAAMDAARVFVEDWAMGGEGVCPGRHDDIIAGSSD